LYVPHGLRIVEYLLLQRFDPEDIAVCCPDEHRASTHPEHRYQHMFIGLETGSVRLFRQ
jgi:hypothetical protein